MQESAERAEEWWEGRPGQNKVVQLIDSRECTGLQMVRVANNNDIPNNNIEQCRNNNDIPCNSFDVRLGRPACDYGGRNRKQRIG